MTLRELIVMVGDDNLDKELMFYTESYDGMYCVGVDYIDTTTIENAIILKD